MDSGIKKILVKILSLLLLLSIALNWVLLTKEEKGISEEHKRLDRLKDSINNHNTRLFRDHECWYQKVKKRN